MTQALTERYAERIAGVLSCYDRLVITGTLPTVCYAEGMTRYLNARGIRIFDYPDFTRTLRERVRETAAALAAAAGVEIEHAGKPHVRKEDIVARVLAQRGEAPGLVHVISAMEACDAYSPGTTSRPTRPSCGRTAASACTTISISWTPVSAFPLSDLTPTVRQKIQFRLALPAPSSRPRAVPRTVRGRF
jgi:hypothetical protein